MNRLLFSCLLFFSWVALFAQINSDSSYYKEKLPTVFKDSTGLYGFTLDGKVVLEPKYKSAFNFLDKFTVVQDTNWNCLMINTNGKVVKDFKSRFVSPIMNKKYIVWKDSVFRVYKENKVLLSVEDYFEVDFTVFLEMVRNSDIPDRELVLRVMTMPQHPIPDYSESITEQTIKWKKVAICHVMMQYYWSTEWLLKQIHL